jgi:hypothetical protein
VAQRHWNLVLGRLRCWFVLTFWVGIGLVQALGADEYLPSLTIGGNTFSNVTIMSRTLTHVSFKHSGGFASVKMATLTADEQIQLGYTPPPPPKSAMDYTKDYTATYTKQFEEWVGDPRVQKIVEEIQTEVDRIIKQKDTTLIYPAIGGVVCIYLLFCLAVVKICKKTTVRPGLWAWLPGFQFISLFKAAGMSPWTYLLLYIPPINLIVMIVWGFKICRTRQKPTALGFLLMPFMIPINILVFFYLAFSSQKRAPAPEFGSSRLKLSYSR